MKSHHIAAAVLAVGLAATVPALAQTTSSSGATATTPKTTTHKAPMIHKKTSVTTTSATKQPTQSLSHSDTGIADGVTKQQ